MSDFQTMDDFAVFVNDYLTPDQLKVQAYSYASDQQELSLLGMLSGLFQGYTMPSFSL